MQDLRSRTTAFALRVMHLVEAIPQTRSGNMIAGQVLRAGTSPGAQYREGIRARSDAELVAKLEGALQELEETAYWLELLVEAKLMPARKLVALRKETDELTAILVSCVKKVKARRRSKQA